MNEYVCIKCGSYSYTSANYNTLVEEKNDKCIDLNCTGDVKPYNGNNNYVLQEQKEMNKLEKILNEIKDIKQDW